MPCAGNKLSKKEFTAEDGQENTGAGESGAQGAPANTAQSSPLFFTRVFSRAP